MYNGGEKEGDFYGRKGCDSRGKDDDHPSSNSLFKGFTPSPDTLRFRENLDQMLKGLRKARRVDNRLLIELEKFYQTTSLLIGLGGLALNEEAFQAWRAYDHWHYEVVKPQLQVYGPTVVL